ncbi:MAG: autotransporter outer membrane beta-barrel domain-containing protein [Magnetospirillum sp. WYHS-4]
MKQYFSMRRALVAVVGIAAVAGLGGRDVMAGSADETLNFKSLAVFSATYSCQDSTYGTNSTYLTTKSASSTYGGGRSTYSSSCVANHTSNSASSVVTSTETLRAATVQTMSLISNRISQRMAAVKDPGNPVTYSMDENSGQIGIAGGNAKKGIGVWVQGAYTSVDNDNVATAFDGNILTGLVGVDYLIKDRFLIGLSAGYESSNIDTTFNRGSIDGSGWMVAPYASLKLTNMFSIDATGGYAWLNYDLSRKEYLTTNETWTGETDATRWFAAGTINADHTIKAWKLHAHAGVLYTEETKDSFLEKSTNALSPKVRIAEQDTTLGQGILGARVGYGFFGGKFTPYVLIQGEWDFSKDAIVVAAGQTKPEDDDFGLRTGLGFNLALGGYVTAQLQGETVLLREDYTEYKGLAKLRVDF